MVTINTQPGIATLLANMVANFDFTTIEVGLFTNDISLNYGVLLTDLTEADYTGYAKKPLVETGNAIVTGQSGDTLINFPHLTFAPTEPVLVANTIWGWFSVGDYNDDAPVLLEVHKFDEAFTIASILDILIVEPRIIIGQPRGN